ncbi:Mg2+ transport system protein [Halapricum desulfuricans]|uniref:Mg2+ transport system protein n=1 Tax=Halapricum desulfuricans TaxID=2841257 RepID=A0A897NEH6_9EURY|nr:MgtC/SapB family protein [Halapricum desulfuricans]QSG10834.1 Mg2+ transport system protein [Halapricum desulfuricans]
MVDPVADPLAEVVLHLLVAFGLGALIGIEREQSESAGAIAGSRTFPLFALYGALVWGFFPDAFPFALAVLAVPLTVAYVARVVYEGDIGLTTVAAALMTVLLGAMTMHSQQAATLAVVVGGAVTVLLTVKDPIHEFADRIERRERLASAKFVLVVLVVLPALPDREVEALYGLNPRFVWLMVVFVTGLGFVAYVLGRVLGTERGIAITGVVGGFVSSTATTVSMAEKTVENATLYHVCGFAVVTASIVMFPRALIEVAVVNPELLPHVVLPLGAMTLVGAVAAVVLYWRTTAEETVEAEELENPFRLRPALLFGAIFAVVLLVSEYANEWFGASGIYATAFFSGLADVDAMTLTLSRLAADGTVEPAVATTGIVIAAVANTFVKAALAWALGTRKLGQLVTLVLGIVVVSGVALLAVVV